MELSHEEHHTSSQCVSSQHGVYMHIKTSDDFITHGESNKPNQK